MKIKARALVKQYSAEYWKSEISKAEDRSKKFVETAEESIRVFNAQKQVGLLNDAERRINVWWYCINTLLPAYYSSTPKAEVSLRKRAGSTTFELSAVIAERNLQYAMDMHFDFDSIGMGVAYQLLLTGRAVLWARYTAKFEKEVVEYALMQDPAGGFVDDQGNPYEGDTSKLQAAPGGIFIVEEEIEKKVDEKAVLDAVQYNDYLCSDARTEAEVEWRSRRAFLSRVQAAELFGEKIAEGLNYDSYPEVTKKDLRRNTDKFEGKAELHEIWCHTSGHVYWLSVGADKDVIQHGEPPIKFPNFYPCSVITQGADPDSVIPVSDYAHVKDQILEVERLTTRIHAVTQAIRTNSLYDSTMGTQVEQLMSGDLKLIPVTNWPSHKGRGGIQNGIETMDVSVYVNALQTLQGARQAALQQLYETLKVSDLLRGTSEQYKTATANRLENQWSSMGLIVRQNQFAKFISDGLANLGAIIATQFDESTIMEVGDADNLISPLIDIPEELPEQPPMQQGMEGAPEGEGMEGGGAEGGMPQGMPPMPQPPMPPPVDPTVEIDKRKREIMDIFRNDKRRDYRIKIASDSMVAVDQAAEQAEGAALIGTAGAYFNEMRSLIEQYPPLLDFSLQLFQNVIRRFKTGKELDGLFQKALSQIQGIAEAKEEAAKQPPPPDPVMQEMQAKMQIAQMESQTRIQVVQMEAQGRQDRNMLDMQDQQMKAQREQMEMQLAMQKAQFDEFIAQQQLGMQQQELEIKANAVQVDMLKVQSNTEGMANKQEVTMENNRLNNILGIHKLELEQMRIKMSEAEKLMEERRLVSDQELERIRVTMAAMKPIGR